MIVHGIVTMYARVIIDMMVIQRIVIGEVHVELTGIMPQPKKFVRHVERCSHNLENTLVLKTT